MSSSDSNRLGRRDLLKGMVTASALAAATKTAGAEPVAQTDADVIRRENQRPGDRDWQLTRVRVNSGKYRTKLIEGYCSHQSIAAGDTLRIFVSTDPARQFTIDVYRMGYYGGAGARKVASLGPLQGAVQPTPPMSPEPARLR